MPRGDGRPDVVAPGLLATRHPCLAASVIVPSCYRDGSVDRNSRRESPFVPKELGATEVIDLKHVYVCSGIRILAPDVRPLSLTADGNSAVLVSGSGICDSPFGAS